MTSINGSTIDATFRVERVGESPTIVFESRGGTRGSEAERNADCASGLELLLARLRDAGFQLADVVVESRDTATLPLEERRLGGMTYPVAIVDPGAIRKWLSAEQAKVGRGPGAKGAGNRTKRLRLFLEPRDALDERTLGEQLERGRAD